MPIASTSTLQHSLLKSPQIQFAICPRHFIQNTLPFEDSNCIDLHSAPSLTSSLSAIPLIQSLKRSHLLQRRSPVL
ncbi:hypothetical protein BT96DRAFT_190520 [Gymnopus androsaceus JB14]|uniref:Uncharacterized protein n=1 Tax=Gymnopus androsaceus JB14 TaxID=1447944 RepID=A0A6A4IC20_9AGAR|nr:hypothetical protein BT96DRAFT_190520 [Gymnopus androsaceus JB14]